MPSVFVLAGEEPRKRRKSRKRRVLRTPRPAQGCHVTFKKGPNGWDALLWKGKKTVNAISYPPNFRLTVAERAFTERELLKHCPTRKRRARR
jgi:hypothetical protein